jgi:hypothetical protein
MDVNLVNAGQFCCIWKFTVDWQYRQFECIKYVHGLTLDDIKGTRSRDGLGFCLHAWADQGINEGRGIFLTFLDASLSG